MLPNDGARKPRRTASNIVLLKKCNAGAAFSQLIGDTRPVDARTDNDDVIAFAHHILSSSKEYIYL